MSEVNYISIKQNDGYITKLTHYTCPDKPKASILILHGAAEHQKRYNDFAKFLVDNSYDVYCYDHRGHGTDKKLNELGFFGHDDGYKLVVQDAINVSNYIQNNNRSEGFFLFGHSMGSLIARNVLQSYDKYHGAILCGTAFPSSFMLRAGLLMASLIKKFKGDKHYSPFLKKLIFEGKKYISLSSRTAFDWLSRNNTVVGAYIHDPYCGFTCTASFYYDLLKLTSNARNKKLMKSTRKNIPLFIISGDRDPVGGYGKEVTKFINTLNKCGFSKVTSKLYPDCRHELLNELNNKDVYSDILKWLEKEYKQ